MQGYGKDGQEAESNDASVQTGHVLAPLVRVGVEGWRQYIREGKENRAGKKGEETKNRSHPLRFFVSSSVKQRQS